MNMKQRARMGALAAHDADAALFGRPQDHITDADRALAAAEWAAMDSEGRLPDGWKYEPQKGEAK